jgi:hypothetical protein
VVNGSAFIQRPTDYAADALRRAFLASIVTPRRRSAVPNEYPACGACGRSPVSFELVQAVSFELVEDLTREACVRAGAPRPHLNRADHASSVWSGIQPPSRAEAPATQPASNNGCLQTSLLIGRGGPAAQSAPDRGDGLWSLREQ